MLDTSLLHLDSGCPRLHGRVSVKTANISAFDSGESHPSCKLTLIFQEGSSSAVFALAAEATETFARVCVH